MTASGCLEIQLRSHTLLQIPIRNEGKTWYVSQQIDELLLKKWE